MNRFVASLFSAALIAAPLSAQNVDFGIWATSTTLQGDNLIDEDADIEIELDENIGWGGTVDVFWGSTFSTELGVYGFDADGAIRIGGPLDETIDLGSLDVMPITLTLRAHFGGERFEGYVGAGGAFVTFDNLESDDLLLVGIDSIDIDDETTWLANAGFSVGITGRLRVGVDAKWIPLEALGVDNLGNEEVPIELDPLMLSGGLIWRF